MVSGRVQTQADVAASLPGVSTRYSFSFKKKAEILYIFRATCVLTARVPSHLSAEPSALAPRGTRQLGNSAQPSPSPFAAPLVFELKRSYTITHHPLRYSVLLWYIPAFITFSSSPALGLLGSVAVICKLSCVSLWGW